jgi:transcriptional regulator with PAS, ATPase and Fis domain
VAEAIHKVSGRRGKHVAVNVCAIPESLFEATLFGQVRGAFTGAIADRQGHFAEANDGTIFLDEIGDLPKTLQAKLLRVLETREYRPVGAEKDRFSNFRVVAATHQDLPERLADNEFRDDLFFRLGGITIRLPSLDERREDVPALVHHFANTSTIVPRGAVFTEAALRCLQERAWPGNVRQLLRTVERAIVCAPDGVVDSYLLDDVLGLDSDAGRAASLDSDDRDSLLRALGRNNWHIEQTAAELGMHRSTLFRRMRKLKISAPQRTPPEAGTGA